MTDVWEQIKNNKDLQALLMRECDICFYKQLQEIQFLENNENYSMQAKAFAHDASGGEFVLLQDESIGFIGSEGEVGRIAESLYFPANIWTVRRNDSLLSDTVGMWVKELSGMTKEEMENNHEHL